jgi:hypothetical protein
VTTCSMSVETGISRDGHQRVPFQGQSVGSSRSEKQTELQISP